MRYRAGIGIVAFLVMGGIVVSTPAQGAEKRLGGGVHYWRTIDDIDDEGLDDIDDDGYGIVGSFQIVPAGLFSFEFDVEYYDDGFGGSRDSVIAPQALVLIGHGLYAGAGVGIEYSDGFRDGDKWSDPFYVGRVGLNLELLPNFFLDINANYQANAFDELDEADTDSITLGALVRIGIGGSR